LLDEDVQEAEEPGDIIDNKLILKSMFYMWNPKVTWGEQTSCKGTISENILLVSTSGPASRSEPRIFFKIKKSYWKTFVFVFLRRE
jgi:hypothetical protein